jgi:hypothetical protein
MMRVDRVVVVSVPLHHHQHHQLSAAAEDMAGCGGGRLASVDYGGVIVRVKSIFTFQVGSATSALLLSLSHVRSA